MKNIITLFLVILFFSCSKSSDNFELCGGKLDPYYHPQLNYEGEFHAIKKAFFSDYKEVDSQNNSGIVKIKFHVNCNGNTGNFKVETYSLEYEDAVIDGQISSKLLQITKELNGWIPAVNEDGEAVNSHKFLAFKIVGGKLTEILPK